MQELEKSGLWIPHKNRAHLFEILATNPKTWGELCCTCATYEERGGIVPVTANKTQAAYTDEVWIPGIRKDMVPKPRKQGFSFWRILLGLHGIHYGPDGRIFRIVAHRDKTTTYLMSLLRQAHKSAWNYFRILEREDPQYDPRYFLRPASDKDQYGNSNGYTFSGGSVVVLETAGGSGVGQADRTDDAYLTEASEYEAFDLVLDGVTGSMPLGETRLTIDFNATANWMSTAIEPMLKSALLGPSDPMWNGFHVFFRGTDFEPERYTEEFLADAKKTYMAIDPTGQRFKAIYPKVIDHLFVQATNAVHERVDVRACQALTGGQYLTDFLDPRGLTIVHGVDTSQGHLDGEWQVCSSFALYDGIWWELCEPIRVREDEDIFAERIFRRVKQYPGKLIVEQNVGSAVITTLRQIDEYGEIDFYRHKRKDKTGKIWMEIGFNTTWASKRAALVLLVSMIREQSVGIVTTQLANECESVIWYSEGGLMNALEGRRKPLAGHPDKKDHITGENMRDDCWTTLWLAIWAAMSDEYAQQENSGE